MDKDIDKTSFRILYYSLTAIYFLLGIGLSYFFGNGKFDVIVIFFVLLLLAPFYFTILSTMSYFYGRPNLDLKTNIWFLSPLFILLWGGVFIYLQISQNFPVIGCVTPPDYTAYKILLDRAQLTEDIKIIIALGFPIILLLALALSIYQLIKTREEKFIWTIAGLIFVGVLAILVAVGSTGFRARSRDARRIGDLRQVQNGLELYYNKFQQYPGVRGESPWSRWDSLSNTIKSAALGFNQIPKDPCNTVQHEYNYGVSNDLQSYVLRAFLDVPENSIFQYDIDGEIYGVWCGEQGSEIEYCVSI